MSQETVGSTGRGRQQPSQSDKIAERRIPRQGSARAQSPAQNLGEDDQLRRTARWSDDGDRREQPRRARLPADTAGEPTVRRPGRRSDVRLDSELAGSSALRSSQTRRQRRPPGSYTEDGRKRLTHQHAFVVGFVSLTLAMLLNSGALLNGAETKPFGASRDRSMGWWGAVNDVANFLSLNRPRDGLAAALGHDADSSLDPTRSFADSDPTSTQQDVTTQVTEPGVRERVMETTTTVPERVEIRRGTQEDPLRVWVGGDSMSKDVAASFAQRVDPLGPAVVDTEGRVVSGLNRLDYFDWIGRLTELAAQPYDVMVAMFGANDLQGMQVGDEVFEVLSDGWKKEYAARVGVAMDQLSTNGRVAYWIGLPPMRSPEFNAKVQELNELIETEAEKRPRVILLDTTPLLGDSGGAYTEFGPGTDGESHELRQADGIHLSLWGANLVADAVIDNIVEHQPALPDPTTSTVVAAQAKAVTTTT